ncbi:MAG: hypothetical protein PHU80_10890 [Kiritimatiellae bacterium]|nr:hypothetical protein [Kiritimatiellia bacterium]
MSKPINITKPVILIGEGRDEERFFSALVDHLDLGDMIQVAEYGGKNTLKGFLSALTAFTNLKAIGVTRDADNDYESAQKAVASAIHSANLPTSLQVSSFILPNDTSHGALEALVLMAVTDFSVWTCVDAFSTCVSGKIAEPFSTTDHDKHRLQAWLSTLPRPGLRLGEAAAAGAIPFDHPAFQPLTAFIKSLVSATENRSQHA